MILILSNWQVVVTPDLLPVYLKAILTLLLSKALISMFPLFTKTSSAVGVVKVNGVQVAVAIPAVVPLKLVEINAVKG